MTRTLLAAIVLGVAACGPESTQLDLSTEIAVDDPIVELGGTVGRVVRSAATAAPRIAGVQPAHARGRRLALVAPAPALVEYEVRVPLRAVLRVGVAVASEESGTEGAEPGGAPSGSRFRVLVDGNAIWEQVWDPEDPHWIDAEVDLGPFAERTVRIGFETGDQEAGPGEGEPAWSRLQIVQRTRVPRQVASPSSPNVLLLVVDTLRADRVGACGAPNSRTPHLDQLAKRGTVFRNTWAQAPWTLPSVTTIMTGRYPRGHGLVGRSARFGRPGGFTSDEGNWAYLGDDVPTIASLAQRTGVTTFGVTSNLLISRENNVARGFETFIELPVSPLPVQWARAADVHRALDRWLDVGGEHRFFAYLHYMEPHEPYVPATRELRAGCPAGAATDVCDGVFRELARASERRGALIDPAVAQYLESLYDGEVRAWDAALPELLDALDRRGLRDRTVILITSDHGEEFAEHGQLGHRKQLFAESLAVPLVIVGPGVPATIRHDLTEHVDIFPTISRILGGGAAPRSQQSDEAYRGRDVLAADTGRRWTFAETRYGIAGGQDNLELQAVRDAAWSYQRMPSLGLDRLYDLATDPAETDDRRATAPTVASELSERLDAWVRDVTVPSTRPTVQDRLDDKLRALGYLE